MISGWDCGVPIHELVEAMDNKEGLIQLERMKRRFIDKETKESRTRLTSFIIVTYEGNVLPEFVTLFEGAIRMKIRPFMEPVRQCFGCFQYGHFKRFCREDRKCMVCGEDIHGECHAEPKYINCGEKHKANDKQKCVLYEYNYNLKRVMADRNMSIHEARQVIRKPYLKREVEWRRGLLEEQEENREKRKEEDRRNTYRMEAKKRQMSYAEVVRSNESSEEEQRKEEWKKKERRITKERERERAWNREYDGREKELKRRDYGITLRRSVSEREEYVATSPSYTNLTSLSTTTRYMTEEVRNLCRIMERRLNLAEEMFIRFADGKDRKNSFTK